ncbi:MAG: DNA repair exonuclease [Clostridiales bacterium]|nr:DNA repair exonuclease [Clostridiales bacterium]
MRFIHLADVHLGAVPDRGCSWSEEREKEIWETFRRVIADIRRNPVDLLFVAGDLFHRQPLLRELREVNYLFSTIPDTRIYLMAGNHDPISRESFYNTFVWEPNVVFFREETLTCVKDEKLDVYVYGLSYHHREIREALYEKAEPRREEGMHILLAHGGDREHIPLNVSALSAKGFDYIALGHIHKPQVLLRDRAAYSGALEPIDRNDLGPHGYIEGRVVNGRLRTEFIPFASRSYQQLILSLHEETTQLSLEDAMKTEIFRRGGQNIYRVILQGLRSPDLFLIPEKLKKLGNVTEVLDESSPAYDMQALYQRYSGTLIGDYIGWFLNHGMNETEKKALYYGLQALLETSRTSGK